MRRAAHALLDYRLGTGRAAQGPIEIVRDGVSYSLEPTAALRFENQLLSFEHEKRLVKPAAPFGAQERPARGSDMGLLILAHDDSF